MIDAPPLSPVLLADAERLLLASGDLDRPQRRLDAAGQLVSWGKMDHESALVSAVAIDEQAETFEFFERGKTWDAAPERFRLHADLCKVLTDPKRLMILEALRHGGRSDSDCRSCRASFAVRFPSFHQLL